MQFANYIPQQEIESVDVVIGLAWGDEGKGKVVSSLVDYQHYDFVCRFNGGPNAGHTVYLDGKQYKTHLIPSGVFHGVPSIVGPGCVINVAKFMQEIAYLEANGFDTKLVKVSPKAHVITQDHITYDTNFLSHLGTTGQGIAPCYADKMLRKGIRAGEVLDPKWIWDEELFGCILAEGAQSVWLDIDHGSYPYVTSSSTLPYNACSLGFSPMDITRIIGVGKMYDTKSGADPMFPVELMQDPVLAEIGKLGKEQGTTTGRQRIVNYLNLDKMTAAIRLSGATTVVLNKGDILNKIDDGNPFKYYYLNELITCKTLKEMRNTIAEIIEKECPNLLEEDVIFSDHPEIVNWEEYFAWQK
jgi:adenylosuccinate synthase